MVFVGENTSEDGILIDFACKQFSLQEVIKCSLGLTPSEQAVLQKLIDSDWERTDQIADALSLDLSTVQRAVKKLHERGVAARRQENHDQGGYAFVYSADRATVKKVVQQTITTWTSTVGKEIDAWARQS